MGGRSLWIYDICVHSTPQEGAENRREDRPSREKERSCGKYISGVARKLLGLQVIVAPKQKTNLTLNHKSIRQQRIECRTEAFRSITVKFTPEDSLIVHWHGKLIPDITRNEQADRISILVSIKGTSKLLEVLKLPSGTGEAQTQAVVDSLKTWSIGHKIEAMCFDTTSPNTGCHKGAWILIEHLLGRLDCRHHIMKLILAAATEEYLGSSTAPGHQLINLNTGTPPQTIMLELWSLTLRTGFGMAVVCPGEELS